MPNAQGALYDLVLANVLMPTPPAAIFTEATRCRAQFRVDMASYLKVSDLIESR